MGNIKQYFGNYYSYFVQGFFALVLGAILPLLANENGLNYQLCGILLAAHSLGSLVTNFVSGIIADYIGRKITIIAFSLCVAVGFIIMIFTGNIILLIFAFFLTGLGRGSITNINNAIVNDKSNGSNSALSLMHTFFAVGAFISPIFVSLLFAGGRSWKYSAWLIVLLIITMIMTFINMDMETASKKITDKGAAEKLFLRDIGFYVSCGLMFFYLGAELSVNGWLVTYLKDSGSMTTSAAQFLLSVLWVVVMAGRLFCAFISRKVSHKVILLLSSSGLLLSFSAFLFSHNMWDISITVCGIGFCFAGIYPATIANSGTIIKGSGLGMGILLLAGGIGGFIMPYITGEISQIAGVFGGMATIGVVILLMFILSISNIYIKDK